MNKLELELKRYLETEGTEIIKESLERGFMNYEKIEIESVLIDEEDESFELRVFLYKNLYSPAISTFPLPQKFLRKMKLKKLEK